MVDILESKVVGTNKETWYKLVGTSEDTKPIGEFPAGTGHTVAKSSTFFEIDTQIKYEFDGSAWAPKGQVDIKLIEKTILISGTYNASDDDADGYSKVTVDIPQDYNAKFVYAGETQHFNYQAIESVIIPNGFVSIADQAFRYCSLLNKVILPTTLTSIGASCFQACTALTNIDIPSSVTNIGSRAFVDCIRLKTITINKPEGSISGAPWGAPDTCQIIWTG